MQPFLEVKLLGEFSVRWGSAILVDSNCRMNKNIELFALLLLNSHQPLTNQELTNLLWDDVVNPAGALKNAVYSLRKLLQDIVPDVPFILTTGQQYQINPDISIQTDVRRCLLLFEQMKQKDVTSDCQLKLGRQALNLCTGEFLPCFAARPWVLFYNHQLISDYISVVCHISNILLKENTHTSAYEAFSICSHASMICPQREDIYPIYSKLCISWK